PKVTAGSIVTGHLRCGEASQAWSALTVSVEPARLSFSELELAPAASIMNGGSRRNCLVPEPSVMSTALPACLAVRPLESVSAYENVDGAVALASVSVSLNSSGAAP